MRAATVQQAVRPSSVTCERARSSARAPGSNCVFRSSAVAVWGQLGRPAAHSEGQSWAAATVLLGGWAPEPPLFPLGLWTACVGNVRMHMGARWPARALTQHVRGVGMCVNGRAARLADCSGNPPGPCACIGDVLGMHGQVPAAECRDLPRRTRCSSKQKFSERTQYPLASQYRSGSALHRRWGPTSDSSTVGQLLIVIMPHVAHAESHVHVHGMHQPHRATRLTAPAPCTCMHDCVRR
jgi:hypothetical protein